MTSATRLSCLAVLLIFAGCLDSPYANFGEALDQTVAISGATWIASVETADGPQTRLLVAAGPNSASGPAFIHTSVIGISPIRKLVGSWSVTEGEVVEFTATTEYLLANESTKPVISRTGSQRRSVDVRQSVSARVIGGRLVISGGDSSLDGSYQPLEQALARLGTTSVADLPCVFQVYNLSVVSSQVRILGFNSASTVQYRVPATFVGEAEGNFTISLTDLLAPLTDITFSTFSDFLGMSLDGTQWTKVNLSGNGHMYGSVAFTLFPVGAGGATLPPVHGSVSYGTQDGSGDSIRLTSGNVTGGSYLVSVAGGASGLVDGATTPVPLLASCLGI